MQALALTLLYNITLLVDNKSAIAGVRRIFKGDFHSMQKWGDGDLWYHIEQIRLANPS